MNNIMCASTDNTPSLFMASVNIPVILLYKAPEGSQDNFVQSTFRSQVIWRFLKT